MNDETRQRPQLTTWPLRGKNFNAQHSPMGAFMSFACGQFGTGGGIGVEIGRPANQNLIVGVKDGSRESDAPIRCLPFARTMRGHGAADYDVEQTDVPRDVAGIETLAGDDIQRTYGWATDAWRAPDFTFEIHTPFGPIPDPENATDDVVRAATLPAVIARLQVDNRNGAIVKTAVFGIDFAEPGARVIRDGAGIGIAWRRSKGFLARVEQEGGPVPLSPFAFQRWSVPEGVADINPEHALGNCGGVAVEVPPGVCCTFVIAIGVYLDGVVTTGLEGRYWYTRYFDCIERVLSEGLNRAEGFRDIANALDAALANSGLSDDQQFLIAHATRSYYGSTQLLDIDGRPFWVVNEGEYCMMNTLDLSVDHVFWELQQNPWVVKNVLDHFSQRYAYVDQLQGRGGKVLPGGKSFTHDMGVNNNFSPPGESSYELPRLKGCFSYMTAEQLCNWLLVAACYVAKTDDRAWLERNGPTIHACMRSLIARGGETGLVQRDSARCQGGQEITTYDSLDSSLAQTRNNAYMAVKCWATYVGLSMLHERLDDAASVKELHRFIDHAAKAITAQAGDDGVIPAIFEQDSPGFASRILPAAEGLVYLSFWDRVSPGALDAVHAMDSTAQLVAALDRHTRTLLLDPRRRNLFDDGGIRLSSTSNNSWMSKIAILQHVARDWFKADEDAKLSEQFTLADAAHVRWQIEGSGFWACSDQFINGIAKGSRYYPRIVTTALWLEARSQSLPTPSQPSTRRA